ncbi:TetR/AcrR family transcriptional regulator [Kitasatospora sp. NBC_00315]|uniref:TetR/AcrR family transcriptional regulator n=1 Tax=Kitasatospora sp. NBC_00315 TaxID=2975963 RepID=UPI00324863A6
MTAQRADARRNYARILAVAEEEVAAHGADASLEQIARTAGVGSATVRRHFPSRSALLEAVFGERIETLCAHAEELAGAADAQAALVDWLRALTTYAASARGMADALLQDGTDGPEHVNACSVRLSGSADPLLQNAAQAGAVAPDVTVADLVALVTGIVLATEHHPDPAAEAHRLLDLTVAGVSPRRPG